MESPEDAQTYTNVLNCDTLPTSPCAVSLIMGELQCLRQPLTVLLNTHKGVYRKPLN